MDDHRRFGVDVKVQKAPRPGDANKLTEDELEGVWDAVAAEFWSVLEHRVLGSIYGVKEVYAEGRSGGWAVPSPHLDPESNDFARFEKICEDTLKEFLENRWPQAVTEQAERKAAEDQDPLVDIKIRRSTAALIAGLLAESDELAEIINGDEPDMGEGGSDQVCASLAAWKEARQLFPLDLFKEHGEWFGKDEVIEE